MGFSRIAPGRAVDCFGNRFQLSVPFLKRHAPSAGAANKPCRFDGPWFCTGLRRAYGIGFKA
jgi:hypothetical protein